MTSSVKAVLFDLDDTLFDHHYSLQLGVAAVQQQYPVLHPHLLSALETTYISLIDKWHAKVLDGSLTLDDARVERFREFFVEYGETHTLEEATFAASLYRTAYQGTRRLIVGARELLHDLRERGIKIVVITNNTVAEQQEKLSYLDLDSLIDVLVISEEVGIAKPNPAIFEAALERAKCQVNEVVMMGDSWSADIVGAHRMGIRAVWLNRFGYPIPDKSMATEVSALEPLDSLTALLLNE